MNVNDIATLVSTVGFPIVCSGFFAWYLVKVESKSNDIIQENTNTLTKLTTLIDGLIRKLDKED